MHTSTGSKEVGLQPCGPLRDPGVLSLGADRHQTSHTHSVFSGGQHWRGGWESTVSNWGLGGLPEKVAFEQWPLAGGRAGPWRVPQAGDSLCKGPEAVWRAPLGFRHLQASRGWGFLGQGLSPLLLSL